MKNPFILLAAVAFALCSCDGNGKNRNENKEEVGSQQIEQVADVQTEGQQALEDVVSEEEYEGGEALLFKSKGTAQDVFPKDCDTICYQWGDLNKDGILDLVLVATPRDPENMMTRSDGYEYNFNEPVLAIYFGKGDETYSLFKEYPNTIPGAVDEFTFVTVESDITEEGVLKFGVEVFYSAGGSETGQNSYLYRFQDDDFYLIGFDSEAYSRYSGEADKVSRNYLTKKQLTTTYNMFDDEGFTDTWTDLPDEPLERLGSRMLE